MDRIREQITPYFKLSRTEKQEDDDPDFTNE